MLLDARPDVLAVGTDVFLLPLACVVRRARLKVPIVAAFHGHLLEASRNRKIRLERGDRAAVDEVGVDRLNGEGNAGDHDSLSVVILIYMI